MPSACADMLASFAILPSASRAALLGLTLVICASPLVAPRLTSCSVFDFDCLVDQAKTLAADASELLVGDCNATCLMAKATALANDMKVGNCNVTDHACLAALADSMATEAQSRAKVAAAEAQAQLEVATADLEVAAAEAQTNLEVATADIEVAAAEAQEQLKTATAEVAIAVDDAWSQAQHEVERQLGCELADSACLREKSEVASTEMRSRLQDAQSSFESSLGCRLDDQSCLQAKASALGAKAAETAEGATDGLVEAIGCGGPGADSDVEACVLRRAQELSVALSIFVSTAVLTGASGGRA